LANAATAQTTADGAVAQNLVQDGQIAAIVTVNNTQNTQIAAIQAVNVTQDNRLTAVEALNLTQSNQISSLQTLTAAHTSQINDLFNITDKDRREARRGTAAAIAITTAPMPSEPGKTSYALNVANYRGEQAVGLSLAHRTSSDNPFAITAGASFAGGKDIGARVGIAGEF
jgi:autotransporter adhesin